MRTGDRVRVLATGDDRLDWAAGLEGEVVNIKPIWTLAGYDGGWPVYYTYHSVTVRTAQGDVTVNDNEVEAL
jgi:uncharacterized membrane protein